MNAAHVPEGVTMEEGASIGVGIVAAAESLFGSLNVPWPDLTTLASESESKTAEKREWILIWGGASTSGMLAIQLAKMVSEFLIPKMLRLMILTFSNSVISKLLPWLLLTTHST